jgi:hypothetical protein
MKYDYEQSIPEFSLINPSLPFLPTNAAIEIDNYRLGFPYDEEPIRHLSKLFNDLTQGEEPKAGLPENNSVLGYVMVGKKLFKEIKKCWKGKSVDAVIWQINLAAKELRDFRRLGEERQKSLSKFCFALSNEIIGYQSRKNQRNSSKCKNF